MPVVPNLFWAVTPFWHQKFLTTPDIFLFLELFFLCLLYCEQIQSSQDKCTNWQFSKDVRYICKEAHFLLVTSRQPPCLCVKVSFHIQSPCRRTVLQTDVRAEDVAWCNSLWLRPGAVCLQWAQFSYFFSFFLPAHRFHHIDGSLQY